MQYNKNIVYRIFGKKVLKSLWVNNGQNIKCDGDTSIMPTNKSVKNEIKKYSSWTTYNIWRCDPTVNHHGTTSLGLSLKGFDKQTKHKHEQPCLTVRKDQTKKFKPITLHIRF